MKEMILIFISIALISSGNCMFAQEEVKDTSSSTEIYLVVKNDGRELIGNVLTDDGREILLLTKELGKIYISKSDIMSISKIQEKSKIIHGEYRRGGPFTTRYVFTTNALPIKKGENYALINLYGPEVHFAVWDNFSLGVMSTWLVSPIMVAAKYSLKTKNENVNFSMGALGGTSGYLNDFKGIGGLYFSNLSLGDRLTNLSISAGYAYYLSGRTDDYPLVGTVYDEFQYSYLNTEVRKRPALQGPVVSIGGIMKVGTKASLIFDSMVGFFPQDNYTTTTTTITEPYYDPVFPHENTAPGYYMHETTISSDLTTLLFIMPGIRIQKIENRAFQFSLAGVSIFQRSRSFSFPIPSVMWFFKF